MERSLCDFMSEHTLSNEENAIAMSSREMSGIRTMVCATHLHPHDSSSIKLQASSMVEAF